MGLPAVPLLQQLLLLLLLLPLVLLLLARWTKVDFFQVSTLALTHLAR